MLVTQYHEKQVILKLNKALRRWLHLEAFCSYCSRLLPFYCYVYFQSDLDTCSVTDSIFIYSTDCLALMFFITFLWAYFLKTFLPDGVEYSIGRHVSPLSPCMVSGFLYGFSFFYISLVDVYTDMSTWSHLNWVWCVVV